MGADLESTRLAACSVRGPKHEDADLPCQDSWAGTTLNDNRFIIAVGDGLGSASHSHEGSAIATETAVDELREYVSTVASLDREGTREAIREAVTTARAAVIDEAAKRDRQTAELNTTLLVTVGGPEGVGGAVVGDGGIICEQHDSYELLLPREMATTDAEYSNVTTPLQSDLWEDSYRFGYLENVTATAVFSDGIDEFVWEGLEEARSAFFDQVFPHVRSASTAEGATDGLSEFLNSDHFRKFSGDDKTLAIATLPKSMVDRKPTPAVRAVDPHAAESDTATIADSSDAESTTADTDDSAANTASTPTTAEETPTDSDDSDSASQIEADTPASNSHETNAEAVIRTASGRQIELAEELSVTPHGRVYRVETEDATAATVFEGEPSDLEQLERKVETMIGESPDEVFEAADSGLIEWPHTRLTDDDGTFVGYLHPHAAKERFASLEEYSAQTGRHPGEQSENMLSRMIARFGTNPTGAGNQYTIAQSLARALAHLHTEGIALSSFDGRIVRTDGSSVCLRKCDTYHIETTDDSFSARGQSDRYAPPEEYDTTFSTAIDADHFALAVHIFQLLMDGRHPFGARGSEAVEAGYAAAIADQPFPYRNPQHGKLMPLEGPTEYTTLPEPIRERFELCFVEGRDNPDLRPPADEWVDILAPHV